MIDFTEPQVPDHELPNDLTVADAAPDAEAIAYWTGLDGNDTENKQ